MKIRTASAFFLDGAQVWLENLCRLYSSLINSRCRASSTTAVCRCRRRYTTGGSTLEGRWMAGTRPSSTRQMHRYPLADLPGWLPTLRQEHEQRDLPLDIDPHEARRNIWQHPETRGEIVRQPAWMCDEEPLVEICTLTRAIFPCAGTHAVCVCHLRFVASAKVN